MKEMATARAKPQPIVRLKPFLPTLHLDRINHVVILGTTDQQRQVVSTLAALPAAVKQEGLESPAIIVLGEVVRLARQETLSELIAVAA